MAVSVNALTLAQYANMSNDPLIQAVTYSLYEAGAVLADVPFVNRKSLYVNGVRWTGSLPTVNWAKVNTDPVVTSGTPSAYQNQAWIVRNAIDVDRVFVEDENQIVDPRAGQVDAWMKSYAFDVNNKFINNDHITGNADAFVGLRYRLDNPTIYGLSGDTKIDAGGVDLSAGGMTQATANTFIEYVQTLLDSMGAFNGDNVVLYMNANMRRKFEKAVRLLGSGAGWDTTKDEYDRKIEVYRNSRVRYIGRQVDQTTEIITSTETNTGAAGSSNYTSIYAVKYGMDSFCGWQFDPLAARDVGLIGNGGSTYRTVIDHVWGFMTPNIRGIGRLYDIKVS